MLDACAPRPARFLEDTDLDGTEEMYLQTGKIQAVLKMDDGGVICELDSYLLRHNFGDTLRRQAEHYYRKIHQREDSPHEHSSAGIASAHERLSFKDKITAGDMVADDHARGLFVDRLNGDFITYRHEPSNGDDSVCQTEVYSQYVKKVSPLRATGCRCHICSPLKRRAYSAPRSTLQCQVAMAGVVAIFIGDKFRVVSVNYSSCPL
jgi:4-alpha-glucanotransferase/alpha-amylase